MLSAYTTTTRAGTIELALRTGSPGDTLARQLGWDAGPVPELEPVWQGRLIQMTRESDAAEKIRRRHERAASDVETPGGPSILDRAKPKPPDATPMRRRNRAERDQRSHAFWLTAVADKPRRLERGMYAPRHRIF